MTGSRSVSLEKRLFTRLLYVDGIWAKLESVHPSGSIKDRMVRYVIENSEEQGLLSPGMTIVEASSGNTGIAVAYFAKEFGYGAIIVMPENMTQERKDIIRSLGAELRLVGPGDFAGAAAERDLIVSGDPGRYFNLDQFANPLNEECHYMTTAAEILHQMGPAGIDAFIDGTGTAGTLIGIGKRLKEDYPGLCLVAIEPSESAIMTQYLSSHLRGETPALSFQEPRDHQISGIGDGFIPSLALSGGALHPLIDRVIAISSQDSLSAAHYLRTQGICVGPSSGANYLASQTLLNEGMKNVVTVFPDSAHKYGSFGLRACEGDCRYACTDPLQFIEFGK